MHFNSTKNGAMQDKHFLHELPANAKIVGYTPPILNKLICSHEKRINRLVYEMALKAYR